MLLHIKYGATTFYASYGIDILITIKRASTKLHSHPRQAHEFDLFATNSLILETYDMSIFYIVNKTLLIDNIVIFIYFRGRGILIKIN